MPIDSAFCLPWQGQAYRHVPYADPASVTDTESAARWGAGRWHGKGEHTLYLASDHSVAVAEFARHMAHRRALVPRDLKARYIFELTVDVPLTLDLRDPRVCSALGLLSDPAWIREVNVTRSTATMLRRESPAQAIIVPSMAFLDQPERWNMVVFREKLNPYPGPHLTEIREVGMIRPAELLGIAGVEDR